MEKEKGRGRLKWLIGLEILLALVVGLGVVILSSNHLRLEVVLVGEALIQVEYGQPFEDPGVQAKVYGNLFWRQGTTPETLELTVSDTLDLSKTGKYLVTYRARYKDMAAEVVRTIRVVDTQSPEIILEEEKPLTPGKPYEEPGFQAIDNYDGDITDKVVRTVEGTKVTYVVLDSSGNPGYAERELPSTDILPPEIVLTGGDTLSVPLGTYLADPGYTASDNMDGDLTDAVEVSGYVDWLSPGSYSLTYQVSDRVGNTATATRQVEILAKERPQTIWPEGKVIYLTFDDGPGPDTQRLLDVLDKYGVKATFFVTDSGYPDLLRQITERGHSIGIHTATHNYGQIYADGESYFRDLFQMQKVIQEATGVTTTLLRFPGGSSNTISRNTCQGLMTTLVEAVRDAGFQYFDWNVDSDDAGKARNAQTVLKNVQEGISQQDVALVLQHDVHSYSVDAVEEIIVWGLNQGYTFAALNENSPGMHHNVYN